MRTFIRKIFFHLRFGMFRNRKQNEVKAFFSKNWLLILLVLCSLLLYVKMSQYSFPWEYNAFTRFFFCSPSKGTFLYGVFDLLNNLGLAYIASFLFYLIIDYFPKRKREQKAFSLAKDHIEQIDVLINQLFSYLMFITGTGKGLEELTFESISKIVGVPLSDSQRYCHTLDINTDTNEVVAEGDPDSINELYSIESVCKNLLAEIDEIMNLPYVMNLEDSLLHSISYLKENRMLDILGSVSKNIADNFSYIGNYSANDVLEVLGVLILLRKYNYPKHRFITCEASQESIELAQETLERMRKQYPQFFSFIDSVDESKKDV